MNSVLFPLVGLPPLSMATEALIFNFNCILYKPINILQVLFFCIAVIR